MSSDLRSDPARSRHTVLAPFPELDWAPSSVPSSLVLFHRWVIGNAESLLTWYDRAKRPKRAGAIWIRGAAIILGALAGLIPLLSKLWPWFDPLWSSLAIALVALLVGYDKFFGFSAGWIRFVKADLKIRQLLDDFQVDWEAERASWQGGTPSPDRVQALLGKAKSLLGQLSATVEQETNAWVAEFQDNLKRIDDMARATAAANEPGAVNLSVTNGAQASSWTLSVDGGPARTSAGATAAIQGLAPGIHTVHVEGAAVSGNTIRAESTVSVKPGQTATLELTLA